MRKTITIIYLIIFCFLIADISWAYEKEIKNISSTIGETIAKSNKKNIAVADFTDAQGRISELGRFLAEEISVSLSEVAMIDKPLMVRCPKCGEEFAAKIPGADKKFEVIDRAHLKTLLKEHKLSLSGLLDPQTTKKLGEIAGADALVTGNITLIGENIRLSVKVLDVATAKIVVASSQDIAKTKALEEMANKYIQDEVEVSADKSTPTETKNLTISTGQKSLPKVNTRGFTFELKSCKLSGDTLSLEMMITNNTESDCVLRVAAKGDYWGPYTTQIFDDIGYEYMADQVQILNKTAREYVEHTFIIGVPIKVIWTVEKISKDATMVKVVNANFKKGDENFTVQFRDIPIEK